MGAENGRTVPRSAGAQLLSWPHDSGTSSHPKGLSCRGANAGETGAGGWYHAGSRCNYSCSFPDPHLPVLIQDGRKFKTKQNNANFPGDSGEKIRSMEFDICVSDWGPMGGHSSLPPLPTVLA